MADEYKANPQNPEETIELIKAMNAIFNAVSDGKVTIGDMNAIPAALKGVIGIEKVIKEIEAMDEAGEAKLAEAIAEFDLASDDELEKLVESYLNWAIETARLADRTIKLIKAKKAVEAIA